MRGAGKGVWRKHHDEIDRQRFPLDLAEIGDPGRDVAAEHIDGDGIADLQAEFAGFLRREGDERLAGIVRRPPGPLRQRRVFRPVFSIGDAAVAAQDPLAARRHVHLADVLPVERKDAAAQHRHLDDLAVGQAFLQQRAEAIDLGTLNIDEEEVRRPLRQAAGELAAQIAVDQRERDEQGKTEAERQDHRRRQRAGAMDIADREPQRRRADARAPGVPARPPEPRRRAIRRRRRRWRQGR